MTIAVLGWIRNWKEYLQPKLHSQEACLALWLWFFGESSPHQYDKRSARTLHYKPQNTTGINERRPAQMENKLCSWVGRLSTVKVSALPKFIKD